jgi:dTMP kinase
MKQMQKGYFITLEGPDGGGKTTQAGLLAEYIKQFGYEVLLTREPGGTPLAEEIRRLILTPTEETLQPMAEILLYAASRAQHVQSLIQPGLAAGKVVICERFVDSSLAYQGYGLGWDLELIRQINRLAVGEVMPDLTFLLDNDARLCLDRVTRRSVQIRTQVDRIEARGVEFQERVRRGYLELASREPRMIIIDTSRKDIETVHREMVARMPGIGGRQYNG